MERFERTYRSSRTLQATFLQRYMDNGREVRSEAGVAYFARPGKMRWEYDSPEHNLYVIDGKWSWFYVPEDHTVTRIRAKESSDWRTPLALLAGEMKVSRICAHVELDSSLHALDSENIALRCVVRGRETSASANRREGIPASDDQGAGVVFEVNPATGELSRVLVSDPGGVQIEFRFANWQFDPPLGAAKFRFEPPKGVAIVDGDLATPRTNSFAAPLSPPSEVN